jgi:hypothetical protein
MIGFFPEGGHRPEEMTINLIIIKNKYKIRRMLNTAKMTDIYIIRAYRRVEDFPEEMKHM